MIIRAIANILRDVSRGSLYVEETYATSQFLDAGLDHRALCSPRSVIIIYRILDRMSVDGILTFVHAGVPLESARAHLLKVHMWL